MITLTVVGLFLVGEFGVPWDEWYLKENAQRNWEWINSLLFGGRNKEEIFFGNVDEHGPVVQMLILGVEKISGASSQNDILWIRHITGYFLCLFGVYSLLRLLKLIEFKNWQIVLTVSLIVFHPRVFGHSFFNSKDTVLMYLFIVSVYLLIKYWANRKLIFLIGFGIVSAIITDMRLIGMVLPIILTILWFLENITQYKWQNLNRLGINLVLLWGIVGIAVILFWPFLWNEPLLIIEKIRSLSKAAQPNPTFFEEQFFSAHQLPLYYIPKFILITTPIPAMLIACCSIISTWVLWLNRRMVLKNKALVFVVVSWLILAAVFVGLFVAKPVLYNGWRHFQFVWPFMVIPGVFGSKWLVELKVRSTKFLMVGSLVVGAFMLSINISYFPFSHTYFNEFVKFPSNAYEVDYWGLSFKQGVDWLEQNEEGGSVYFSDKPGRLNYSMASDNFKNRFELSACVDSADFYVTNYCYFDHFNLPVWHGKRAMNHYPFNQSLIHTISRDKVDILAIYRLN